MKLITLFRSDLLRPILIGCMLVSFVLLTRGTCQADENKKFNWSAALVGVIGQEGTTPPTPTPPPSNESCSGSQGFVVCTTSFTNGEALDTKYTLYGNNISPHLFWKNPPAGTASFGIYVYDADATDSSGDYWTHWMLQVPGTVNELAENAGAAGGGNLPAGSNRANNSFYGLNVPGAAGTDYDGPMPPSGTGTHHYYFVVQALDGNNVTIETASLVGTYTYQSSIDPPAPPDN